MAPAQASTARQRYVAKPEWSRLELWMRLRERFAGIPGEPPPAHAEPPPAHAEPPVTH